VLLVGSSSDKQLDAISDPIDVLLEGVEAENGKSLSIHSDGVVKA
jgi:hypothetical protein